MCDHAEPHLHPVYGPVFIRPGASQAIVLDGRAVGLMFDQVVADRVVNLLARHGLLDVPDSPTSSFCPWPPPRPADRRPAAS